MSSKYNDKSPKIPAHPPYSDIVISPVERSILTIIVQYLDEAGYDFLVKIADQYLGGDSLNVAKAIILTKHPDRRVDIGYKPNPAIDRVVEALLSWNKAVTK